MRSMACALASAPAITTAGSPGSRCMSRNASTATSSSTGTAWASRIATSRVIDETLLEPDVPEPDQIVGREAVDLLGVVGAQVSHVGNLDHVGLVEHALLDRGPRGLALLEGERGIERRIGVVEHGVVLDVREGLEHQLLLLRPEQPARALAGGPDVSRAVAALHARRAG